MVSDEFHVSMPTWDDVSLPAVLDALALNIVLEQSRSFVLGRMMLISFLFFLSFSPSSF